MLTIVTTSYLTEHEPAAKEHLDALNLSVEDLELEQVLKFINKYKLAYYYVNLACTANERRKERLKEQAHNIVKDVLGWAHTDLNQIKKDLEEIISNPLALVAE